MTRRAQDDRYYEITDAVSDGFSSSEVTTFFDNLYFELLNSALAAIDTQVREWLAAEWPKLMASIVTRISYDLEMSQGLEMDLESLGDRYVDTVVERLKMDFEAAMRKEDPTLAVQDVLDGLESEFTQFIEETLQ